VYEVEQSRLQSIDERSEGPSLVKPLSTEQQRAHDEILSAFESKNVCLLHGVTSSGKTEVYIQLIREVLAQGKQVLYLVPEIALTTQLTDRLGRVFGSKMGIYHSKFSDAERVELWQRQLSDKPYPLILGVRSSVFLPFQNLGLIIVDEETDGQNKSKPYSIPICEIYSP
jgi:primosomal protein N' (replication factor Y)